jgi:hypothetical protein
VNPEMGKYPLSSILEGKYPDYPVYRLKDKLIRSRKKDACCEKCKSENVKELRVPTVGTIILCTECSYRKVIKNGKEE